MLRGAPGVSTIVHWGAGFPLCTVFLWEAGQSGPAGLGRQSRWGHRGVPDKSRTFTQVLLLVGGLQCKGKLTTRNRNGEGHSCLNGEDAFMQSEWGEHAGDSYAGRKWIVVIFECKHKIVTWPLPNWLSCLQASLPPSREKTSTTNKRQKALPKSSSNPEAWILLIIVFRWRSFWKNQSYKMY